MDTQNIITSISDYIEGCFEQPSMQHQHLSGIGAVSSFEKKLCRYYNKSYAVAFSNATTALQALCIALELYNSEIITSPINWGGSITPFLLHKNKLRFTSYDFASLTLSIQDLASVISPKTKAVLSVDYNGIPVDAESIKEFCLDHNLFYISDSAQSMGAHLNNRPAGYYADATVLSFSPGKSCFGGEGGAIVTDNQNLYEKLLLISQHPSKQKTVLGLSNYNEYLPINGRMNPLSAILLDGTFELSLDNLKEYQKKCIQLLFHLQEERYIISSTHIDNTENSSFFCFSGLMRESVEIKDVNMFLRRFEYPFTAISYLPKIIPFDFKFRNQYKCRFSCSKELLRQRKLSHSKNRIKLMPLY